MSEDFNTVRHLPEQHAREHIIKARECLTLPSELGQHVTDSELQHVVLTVAAALLNPGQSI